MIITPKKANSLLEKYLTGTTPLTCKDELQDDFFERVRAEIKQHPQAQAWQESSTRYYHKKEAFLGLYYNCGDRDSEEINLEFKDQQLSIVLGYHVHHFVYSLDQLYPLLENLKKAIDQRFGEQLKKQKIKRLKYQAIHGKIKELAKAEEFDYHLKEYQTKIKLSILLDAKVLEVDIHNNKFQTVLQDLQAFIRSVRELHQSGISFRFKTTQSHHHGWIRHQEL